MKKQSKEKEIYNSPTINIKTDEIRNVFIVNGVEYPPTQHNSDIIKVIMDTGKDLTLRLSNVKLDF